MIRAADRSIAPGAVPMVSPANSGFRLRAISTIPAATAIGTTAYQLPSNAKTIATAQETAMPCSTRPISFDCECRRSIPRRLPGIGCHRFSSAVEATAPTQNIVVIAATVNETSASPIIGNVRIKATGSVIALSLAQSTAAGTTGAEAISSGASSPETTIQASEAATCEATTTMVGANASTAGRFSFRNSTTAIGTV